MSVTLRRPERVLYRYNDGEHIHAPVLREIEVLSETPGGHWVSLGCGDKRFVLSSRGKKRYAYPTKQEALASYVARKKRQCEIFRARLQRAEECLRRALEMSQETHGEVME